MGPKGLPAVTLALHLVGIIGEMGELSGAAGKAGAPGFPSLSTADSLDWTVLCCGALCTVGCLAHLRPLPTRCQEQCPLTPTTGMSMGVTTSPGRKLIPDGDPLPET